MTTGIVTGQVAVHCDVCTSETGDEPRVRLQAQRGGRTLLIACWPCLVQMRATLDALMRQGRAMETGEHDDGHDDRTAR